MSTIEERLEEFARAVDEIAVSREWGSVDSVRAADKRADEIQASIAADWNAMVEALDGVDDWFKWWSDDRTTPMPTGIPTRVESTLARVKGES